MPDMDSPTAKNVSAIIEASGGGVAAGGGGGAAVKALSKRPREETSPVSGKRGRGENGDMLMLQVPHVLTPALSVQATQGNTTPRSPPPPPLLESPSKLNRASPFAVDSSTASSSSSSASSTGFTAFPGLGTAKEQWSPCAKPDEASSTPDLSWGQLAAARRKTVPPPKALPSLAATDPVFHAALLRVLHRRGGETCPEAQGWRWSGDAPARFNHWPCALHPDLMNLLAYISAGEERVVLTGCDVRGRNGTDCCSGGGREEDETAFLPPPPPREPSPWRAVSSVRGDESSWAPPPAIMSSIGSPSTGVSVLAATAGGTTPRAPTRARPALTPCSALRAPAGVAATPESRARSAAKSRGVRFATHDMTVVDTPDPIRGGSEKGMVSALGGLQSILSAAEQVRLVASLGASVSASGSHGGGKGVGEGTDVSFSSRLRAVGAMGTLLIRGGGGVAGAAKHGEFEDYFDRFSSGGNSNRRNKSDNGCDEGSDSDDNDGVGNTGTRASKAANASACPVPTTNGSLTATGPDRNAENPAGAAATACQPTDKNSSRVKHSFGEPLSLRTSSSNSNVDVLDMIIDNSNKKKTDIVAGAREKNSTADAGVESEGGKRLAEDIAALIEVLQQMACSNSAPGELVLEAGWGPEHSNATAFYARELAMLCGKGAWGAGEGVGVLGSIPEGGRVMDTARASHLRVRYLDVLSCLIRYNLKVNGGLCFFPAYSVMDCVPLKFPASFICATYIVSVVDRVQVSVVMFCNHCN